MKRPQTDPDGNTGGPGTAEMSKLFPTIAAYLTEATWDDGATRELATLLLFVDGTRWKLCLNDRALGRVAFVTGADPEEALTQLEDGLARDSLDWRSVARKVRTPGRP